MISDSGPCLSPHINNIKIPGFVTKKFLFILSFMYYLEKNQMYPVMEEQIPL